MLPGFNLQNLPGSESFINAKYAEVSFSPSSEDASFLQLYKITKQSVTAKFMCKKIHIFVHTATKLVLTCSDGSRVSETYFYIFKRNAFLHVFKCICLFLFHWQKYVLPELNFNHFYSNFQLLNMIICNKNWI